MTYTAEYLRRRVRSHEEVVAQIRVNVLEDARTAYFTFRSALENLKADDRADAQAERDIQDGLNGLDDWCHDFLEAPLKVAENALADATPDEYAGERSVIQWKQVG